MKLIDFTVPELDYFRAVCGFSNVERTFFDLRTDPSEYTLEDIAELMHSSLSTIKRINNRVKNKIIRVL